MNIDSYLQLKRNLKIPDFKPGDSVRVHAKIIEGDRQRIQAFEGVVLRIRRGGAGSNFTVRRISHGIGVERIFPYFSPLIDKVEVTRVGRVRRAKLYYLRGRVGKSARIKAGTRARFEALTAPGAVMPEEEYVEEEEVAAGEEIEAEGAEDAAEAGEEPAGAEAEAAVEPEAEASAEEPEAAEAAAEPAAEDVEASEEEAPVEEAEPAVEDAAPEDEAEAEKAV